VPSNVNTKKAIFAIVLYYPTHMAAKGAAAWRVMHSTAGELCHVNASGKKMTIRWEPSACGRHQLVVEYALE
jgi:hypothetical protein